MRWGVNYCTQAAFPSSSDSFRSSETAKCWTKVEVVAFVSDIVEARTLQVAVVVKSTVFVVRAAVFGSSAIAKSLSHLGERALSACQTYWKLIGCLTGWTLTLEMNIDADLLKLNCLEEEFLIQCTLLNVEFVTFGFERVTSQSLLWWCPVTSKVSKFVTWVHNTKMLWTKLIQRHHLKCIMGRVVHY